jgi:hypothetical protein
MHNKRWEEEVENERKEARKPYNHAFSAANVWTEKGKRFESDTCYWCGNSRSVHRQSVDVSSGVRRVS